MARRGNREGNIRKKGDGRWEASVQFAGRRYWASGRTKAEARTKLTDLKRRHHIGELTPPTRLTVAAFLDQWLAANEGEWKPKTLVGYQALVRNYWQAELGHVRLQQLTPPMIASCYARWKAERRIKGGTLLNVHRCLHRALRVAVLWGYIPNNPADRVEPPKASRSRPKLWTPDQARHFLDVTKHDRWHLLWSLLLGTGCRLGEALGLEWSDIDFDQGAVTIARSISYPRRSARVVVMPKTEAGRRTVQLPDVTLAVLAERLRGCVEIEERGGGPVVTLADGGLPNQWQARTAFLRACGVAGVPRIRIHDLRHLSASLLLADGTPLPVVSARLGHASTAVTAAIYSHALAGGDEQAADALGRQLHS